MSTITRRRFLISTAAAAAGTIILPRARRGRAEAAAPISLTAERRTIEVNGKAASVFGLRQSDGTPGVVLDPDRRFAIEMVNQSGEPTIVHWHGQTPPCATGWRHRHRHRGTDR